MPEEGGGGGGRYGGGAETETGDGPEKYRSEIKA